MKKRIELYCTAWVEGLDFLAFRFSGKVFGVGVGLRDQVDQLKSHVARAAEAFIKTLTSVNRRNQVQSSEPRSSLEETIPRDGHLDSAFFSSLPRPQNERQLLPLPLEHQSWSTVFSNERWSWISSCSQMDERFRLILEIDLDFDEC